METGPGLDEGSRAKLDCVMEKSLGDAGTLPRDTLSLSCSGLEKSRPAVREPSSVSWESPPVKVLAGPSVFRRVRTNLLTSEGIRKVVLWGTRHGNGRAIGSCSRNTKVATAVDSLLDLYSRT